MSRFERPDHRLLRDLIHFKWLTPAQRQRGKDDDRRGRIFSLLPPESLPRGPHGRRWRNQAGLTMWA